MSRTGSTYHFSMVRIVSGTATAVCVVGASTVAGYIDASDKRVGMIRVPSAWTAADITFMAVPNSPFALLPSDDIDAQTSAKVRNKSATLLKISSIVTNEAGWYEIPSEVMALGYFQVRSTNTGSEADVNQGADRDLIVALKS